MNRATLTGRVLRLVNGGQGLIHHEAGTVLVNDVMPGETVLFTIREHAKGICWADLAKVLEPHPQRITPPCPLSGTCGGCAWQHIPLPLQRQLKTEILQESSLRQLRTAVFPARLHPSPGEKYRIRARMKPDKQGRLGFIRRRSHEIIPISDCLLFCDPINTFLSRWNTDPPRMKRLFQADLLYSPSEESLGLHLDTPPDPKELKDLRRRFPDLKIGWPGQESVQRIAIPESGVAYHASAGAFFQVNRFLWPVMLETVRRHLPEKFSALDLYSGVGFLIPPLLHGEHPPMAAENHPLSVDLFKRTFPQLAVFQSDTGRLEIPSRISLIVCDPPRSGLNEKTRQIISSSSADTLLIVSCNQATLLRDIGEFLRFGWTLQTMEAFDLFPHTPHLELFAKLTR